MGPGCVCPCEVYSRASMPTSVPIPEIYTKGLLPAGCPLTKHGWCTSPSGGHEPWPVLTGWQVTQSPATTLEAGPMIGAFWIPVTEKHFMALPGFA